MLDHLSRSRRGRGLTRDGIQALQEASRRGAKELIDDVIQTQPHLAKKMGEMLHGARSHRVISAEAANAPHIARGLHPPHDPRYPVIVIEGAPAQTAYRAYDGVNAVKEGRFMSFENPTSMSKAEYRSRYAVSEEFNGLTDVAEVNVEGAMLSIGKTSRISDELAGGGLQIEVDLETLKSTAWGSLSPWRD